MATSLASDTRAAFAHARPGLTQIELDLVRRARRTANRPSGERDRLLESVVLAYRSGDRQLWGAVLLDLLTPALLDRLRLFRPEPPVIDVEDLRAELVLQLLEAAATMPFPTGLRFVERRLVLRAGQGVRRWVGKERRRRATCQPLDSLFQERRDER